MCPKNLSWSPDLAFGGSTVLFAVCSPPGPPALFVRDPPLKPPYIIVGGLLLPEILCSTRGFWFLELESRLGYDLLSTVESRQDVAECIVRSGCRNRWVRFDVAASATRKFAPLRRLVVGAAPQDSCNTRASSPPTSLEAVLKTWPEGAVAEVRRQLILTVRRHYGG
jgi:hypothetical protein